MALWEVFDEEIVLYKQGGGDFGREIALGKHLAPDLQAFQEMAASFSQVRVLEGGTMALRTRHFSIKGKLPNRYSLANGYETQTWTPKNGAWKLVHMHWSFPGG